MRASNESSFETRKPSLESPETSIFYMRHSKGFRETIILFLEKHNNDHSHVQQKHRPTALVVKFLGDKKGPTKGFYLEAWKIK